MTLLWCDQPQDDEPRLPCMDTAVYGTSRCLRHQPPGGTVVLKPLAPIPAADMLAGEGLKPVGWVACSCGNCPEVPPAPEPEPGGSETGGNAPADLYTVNPDAEPPHGPDVLTVLRVATMDEVRAEAAQIYAELRERRGNRPYVASAVEAVVRQSFRRRFWTALTRRRTA